MLKKIAEKANKLREMQAQIDEMEQELKHLKERYRTSQFDLCTEMRNIGMDEFKTTDGACVKIKQIVSCRPNKNISDQYAIAEWVRQNGGESMVQTDLLVSADKKDLLQGIPYLEVNEINTNKLKAWISDCIGLRGGSQQFTYADIPPCVHFNILEEVEINE